MSEKPSLGDKKRRRAGKVEKKKGEYQIFIKIKKIVRPQKAITIYIAQSSPQVQRKW
jgi:hypothetical protein